MNSGPGRAREACTSCRRDHKKCKYDEHSTQCHRCDERGIPCSLFVAVEDCHPWSLTLPANNNQPVALMAQEPTVGSWGATPNPTTSPSFQYHYPTQELFHWQPNVPLEGPVPEQYSMQPSNNQYASEQPMNYGYGSNEVPERQDPRSPGYR
ncbi:hypothetical protein BDN67DRAFT_966025 [Paxillus ammoniavirescens]|nr:hypothetical protein BDN67DRAFT_966025 [Paxillus ammoniavirescens]